MKLQTMELMNLNYARRKNDKNGSYISNLGDIQKDIINSYVKNPHTLDEIESFNSHLFGDKKTFADKAHMYESLDGVYSYWENAKSNIQIYGLSEEQSYGKAV